jgi:glycosyltransferase involved in cell wall biosynthesis
MHAFILSAYSLIRRKRVVINIRSTPIISMKWKIAFRFSNAVITLSDDIKHHIIKNCNKGLLTVQPQKVVTVPSIVELSSVNTPEIILPHECIRIGYFAHFNKLKNQLGLLRGLPKFLKNKESTQLYLVGAPVLDTDSYLQEVKKLIEVNDLKDWVSIIPFQNDLTEWYKEIDISIIASQREGLARAMIESMSHKIPVVSFSVSSAKEYLESTDSGFVVPIDYYKMLAEKIDYLVDNPRLLTIMCHNGYRFVKQKLNGRVIAEQYAEVYNSLLNG